MTTAVEKNEAEVLQALRSRYERNGYTFVAHPPSELLPEFLKGYQPDAIALSDKGSVIIEVKMRRGTSTEKNLAQIANRVAAHPGWKLEVFYGNNFTRRLYTPPTNDEILSLLREVEGLREGGHERAAYVMGWGTLEALTRALRSRDDDAVPPMIPGEIVEWLSKEGYLSPSEQRELRHSVQSRNAIVHGETTAPAPSAALLYDVIDNLAREIGLTVIG